MNTEYTWISGGVTAANGFKASGIHCGLRKNIDRLDLALIYSEKKCAAAGVFTKNKVFAAPVGISKQHLQSGYAQAIICNSGNANTCTEDGYDKATATCTALAAALSIPEDNVLVASTGVIGQPLPVEYILNGISELTNQLDQTVEASDRAARAIMTTDTKKKEFAMSYKHGNTTITLGGICKGSGMIEPNMATMLGFITTDINISPEILSSALKKIIPDTFNMISVDGDTSTNDSVIILASGMCGNTAITSTTDDGYSEFENALRKLCTEMCMSIAADGEGATKLLECRVTAYKNVDGAKKLAKSVIRSPLVKAAMFGSDANWGRVLCALGYSGEDFEPLNVNLCFSSSEGSIDVCKNGVSCNFDEDTAKKILSVKHIYINVNMGCGNESATAWGCDLTYDYVKINGDYRS